VRPAKGAAAGTAFLGIFRDFRERNLTTENTENAEENRQGVAERKEGTRRKTEELRRAEKGLGAWVGKAS